MPSQTRDHHKRSSRFTNTSLSPCKKPGSQPAVQVPECSPTFTPFGTERHSKPRVLCHSPLHELIPDTLPKTPCQPRVPCCPSSLSCTPASTLHLGCVFSSWESLLPCSNATSSERPFLMISSMSSCDHCCQPYEIIILQGTSHTWDFQHVSRLFFLFLTGKVHSGRDLANCGILYSQFLKQCLANGRTQGLCIS